jgi:hypothetical protein
VKVANFKLSQGINLNPKDQIHQKVVTHQSISTITVNSSQVTEREDPILKNLMPSQKVAYLKHLKAQK